MLLKSVIVKLSARQTSIVNLHKNTKEKKTFEQWRNNKYSAFIAVNFPQCFYIILFTHEESIEIVKDFDFGVLMVLHVFGSREHDLIIFGKMSVCLFF